MGKLVHGASWYQGQWQDDRQHGVGTHCLDGGERYVGEAPLLAQTFLSVLLPAPRPPPPPPPPRPPTHPPGQFQWGLRHGKGRCAYSDGTKYEGEWEAGRRAGKGACAYANGDKYQGARRWVFWRAACAL